MIREVPVSILPAIWEVAEPHLTAALEHHPFLDSKGLLQRVLSGMASLCVVIDGDQLAGVVAMEVIEYPGRRIGNVLALGGKNGSMERFDDEVEHYLVEWCRSRSLVSLAMLGRPGWSRVLGSRGWRTQPMCVAWLPLQA